MPESSAVVSAVKENARPRAEKTGREFVGGYNKLSRALNLFFDITFSLFLILISAPLQLFVALAVKLYDNGPILYCGPRLGKDKVPFRMYKFRSMVVGADQKIGERVLESNLELITPFGRFLRFTRLDELPQLFNILKGDMAFVGPRPLPPIVYEKFCRQIKGFDRRFMIKPGLIGYSQLFTPHGSPNRIRSLIDNRFLSISQNFIWDVILVYYTIFVVVRKVVVSGLAALYQRVIREKILGNFSEKRVKERIRPNGATMTLSGRPPAPHLVLPAGKVIDVNEDALLVWTPEALGPEPFPFSLSIRYRNGRRRWVRKTAHCTGTVLREGRCPDAEHGRAYVVDYTANTAFSHYIMHRYFLNESVAQ